MKRAARVGRNEPCPCGSGRKFKRCCEAAYRKGGLASRLMLAGLLCVMAAAILLGVFSLSRDSGSAGPRQVWSPEHGHYHEVR